MFLSLEIALCAKKNREILTVRNVESVSALKHKYVTKLLFRDLFSFFFATPYMESVCAVPYMCEYLKYYHL